MGPEHTPGDQASQPHLRPISMLLCHLVKTPSPVSDLLLSKERREEGAKEEDSRSVWGKAGMRPPPWSSSPLEQSQMTGV